MPHRDRQHAASFSRITCPPPSLSGTTSYNKGCPARTTQRTDTVMDSGFARYRADQIICAQVRVDASTLSRGSATARRGYRAVLLRRGSHPRCERWRFHSRRRLGHRRRRRRSSRAGNPQYLAHDNDPRNVKEPAPHGRGTVGGLAHGRGTVLRQRVIIAARRVWPKPEGGENRPGRCRRRRRGRRGGRRHRRACPDR